MEEQLRVYAKVRGVSIEGRNATILTELPADWDTGSDNLSSSKFDEYEDGNLVAIVFKQATDGKRIIVNVHRVTHEDEVSVVAWNTAGRVFKNA